ncbi:MAG: hypothetical protein II801_03930 [Bacteroidaceae bacterium]|nr:hypothetical protein [Bacteroidaceae bacterium]
MKKISSADEMKIVCGRKKFHLRTKFISTADGCFPVCTAPAAAVGCRRGGDRLWRQFKKSFKNYQKYFTLPLLTQ